MLPESLTCLFNAEPAIYKRMVRQSSNFYALFTDVSGTDFLLRREDLYSYPTIDMNQPKNRDTIRARQDMARDTHSEFIRQLLRKDVALFLHAERLQTDILRMTFQRFSKLDRTEDGYTILIPEFPDMLDRSLMKLKATETGGYTVNPIVKSAARHNINMLKYLSDPSPLPPSRELKPFIKNVFEAKL